MNEKATELVGRMHAWAFYHPWLARPFWYFALLVVVLGFCHWAFNSFNLYHTDADSARYLLSAMVQAQAAIVAIVITLTLIAVQLTASAYTPRVIRVFKNNPDMWILLVIYGVSMLYGLIVLKMLVGEVVVGEAGEIVSQDVFWVLGYVPMSFECCVSVAYWLQAFTFVALFPYMLNIIGLLEAEAIMQRLSNKITSENVLEFIISEEKQNNDRTEPAKDDPVQPIVDVIHGAVMKYDIATTRYGLKAITEKAIEVVRSEYLFSRGYLFSWDDVPGNDSRKLLEYLIDKFGIEWAKLKDIRKSDENAITISEGGNSVKITLDGDKENATKATLKIISDGIKIHDLKVRMENGKLNIYHSDYEIMTSRHFCAHLERVGKLALSREDDESVIKVLESLESFGKSTAEKRLKGAPLHAARSLGVVGKIIAENGLEDVTKHVAQSLERFGKLTAEKGLGDATFEVTKSLGVILKIIAENGRWDVTKQVAIPLCVVGIVAYNRMDAAKKDGKQRWVELDRATVEAAKHLKLSMSFEELREILLDVEQRYGNESALGFIQERGII